MKRRLFWAAAIFAGWTFLAVLFTPQAYFLSTRSPTPLTWGAALAVNLNIFYVWAGLTPLVLWLGRRFPVERGRLARNLAVHFLSGFAVALLQILIYRYTSELVLGWMGISRGRAPVRALLVGFGATNVMEYWGIVAISQSIIYFRRFKERELRLAQAQLQVLKLQLHPHFLFNTLNAISELVYDDAEKADRTITRLSDLLRLSLRSETEQEVPLKEELDFIQKYVEIQQTLLQERLVVRYEVADDVLSASVPNMILQPLVENAIRHGITPRVSGGTVEFAARRAGDLLALRVRDDGVGLKPGTDTDAGDNIGLVNTRARLRHLYADAYEFNLSETPGGGLTVNLIIPFREHTRTEADEDSHVGR